MPNHVTTICTVTGPEADIARFESAHIVEHAPKDGGTAVWVFEFQTIIPRPESLDHDDIENSNTEAAMAILVTAGANIHIPLAGHYGCIPKDRLKGLPIHHADQAFEWLTETHPEWLEPARLALRNLADHGAAGWYKWNIREWGTKWGAYDYELRERAPSRLVFEFQTAWSFPEPIFRKLATMYPVLTFGVVSYDEGDNFACVGSFNGEGDFRTVPCTPDLYRAVYGDEAADEREAEAKEGGAA